MHDNNGRGASLRGRRVMISGICGFLGSHLAESLLRKGAVVGGIDLPRLAPTGLHDADRCKLFFCDLADPQESQAAIAEFGPEIFFHFAAHPDGPEDYQQAARSIHDGMLLTLNALEGFRQSGGELFVYGDSTKVYGDGEVPYRQDLPARPLSSYAIAKNAGWEFCRLYERIHGVHCVSVRPTMIYGPRQAYNLFTYVIRSVLEMRPQIILDGGDQTRDPLYVGDAMEAYLRIAGLGKAIAGRVINIGGGHEYSVLELARLVTKLMESPIPVIPVARKRRPTEMARSFCDNLEARQVLGWQPTTELAVGLLRTIEELAGRQQHPATVKEQVCHVPD